MDDDFLHELMEYAGRELRDIRVVKKEQLSFQANTWKLSCLLALKV